MLENPVSGLSHCSTIYISSMCPDFTIQTAALEINLSHLSEVFKLLNSLCSSTASELEAVKRWMFSVLFPTRNLYRH